MSESHLFSGDKSNGSFPDASPEEQEVESKNEKDLRSFIGGQIDAAADAAEKSVENNPNITVFGPESTQDSVKIARSAAMVERAERITVSLFGEVIDNMNLTDEDKKTLVQRSAGELVGQHLASKRSEARDDLAAKFD